MLPGLAFAPGPPGHCVDPDPRRDSVAIFNVTRLVPVLSITAADPDIFLDR